MIANVGEFVVGLDILGFVAEAAPAPLVFENELLDWLDGLGLARAFAGQADQSVKPKDPVLIVNLVSEDTPGNLEGADGIAFVTAQIVAYAGTRRAAAVLAETVAARLANFTGRMGAAWVENVWRDDGSTITDPLDNATGKAAQGKLIQYEFQIDKPNLVFTI